MELKRRSAAELLQYFATGPLFEMRVIDDNTITFVNKALGIEIPFRFTIVATMGEEETLKAALPFLPDKPPPTVTFNDGTTIKLDDAESYLRHKYAPHPGFLAGRLKFDTLEEEDDPR